MILLCGIPSEPTFAMVCEQVEKQGAPALIFNQRMFKDIDIDFEIISGQIKGILCIAGLNHRLEDIGGVYTRLMDPRHLPEVEDEPSQSMLRQRCFTVHYTLMQWYNIAPGRCESNWSHGIKFLQTLPVAADPEARIPSTRDPRHKRPGSCTRVPGTLYQAHIQINKQRPIHCADIQRGRYPATGPHTMVSRPVPAIHRGDGRAGPRRR